jgi:hypothetical protein
MSQQGYAIAGCAVQVFFAVYIPDKRAFASCEHDWFFGENIRRKPIFNIHYFFIIH